MASSGGPSDHAERKPPRQRLRGRAGLGWRENQKPSLVLVLLFLLPTYSRRGMT